MRNYITTFCFFLSLSISAQQAMIPIGQNMSNSQCSVSVSIGQIHYITIPEVWSGVQQPTWIYYSVTTKSDIGTTIGDGKYRVGDTATIAAATTDMCYAFTRWSDNNTSNPRDIKVMQDTTLTAIFEKIQFNITLETEDESKGEVYGE